LPWELSDSNSLVRPPPYKLNFNNQSRPLQLLEMADNDKNHIDSYIPLFNRYEDKKLLWDFVEKHSFGTIITVGPDGIPLISSIPFLLEKDQKHENGGKLFFHLSDKNSQCKTFTQNQQLLIVFSGPHSYISPKWYGTNDVPTWNYSEVRIYGCPSPIEAITTKLHILNQLVARNEDTYNKSGAWTIETLDKLYVEQQINHIKFYEISVKKMEAKFKMSQNRSKADQLAVIEALGSSTSLEGQQVSQFMKELTLWKQQQNESK